MRRWCEPGGHHVLDHDAQILRTTITGSGPGTPVYACHRCVRDGGLVPEVAFIGRRDRAPIVALTAGASARRCDHCGRETTAWTAQGREDDRGPVEIVWCRDSVACDAARRATRPPRVRVRPTP